MKPDPFALLITAVFSIIICFPSLASAQQDSLNNALLEAARIGELEDVKELLAAGANVNARDSLGRTPLILSAMRDYKTKLVFIPYPPVDLVGSAEWQSFVDSLTAAHEAYFEKIKRRHLIIPTLIKAGADINSKDISWWTPLMHAVNSDNFDNREEIENLINFNADLKATNKDGETAMSLAKNKGDKIYLKMIADGEEIRKFAKEKIESGKLFLEKPEFLPLTLLRRCDFDKTIIEVDQKPFQTWRRLCTGEKKVYKVPFNWTYQRFRVGIIGQGRGMVVITAENGEKSVLFYYGEEEKDYDRAAYTKTDDNEGSGGEDILLLRQVRNQWTFEVHEEIYMIHPVGPNNYLVSSEDSLLNSERITSRYRLTSWILIFDKLKDYRRRRAEVFSAFAPHLRDFKIADMSYIPAWKRDDIDGDSSADLAAFVEKNEKVFMAVKLSSRPDTVFELECSFANRRDFIILPEQHMIRLIYWDKAPVDHVWRGENFETIYYNW